MNLLKKLALIFALFGVLTLIAGGVYITLRNAESNIDATVSSGGDDLFIVSSPQFLKSLNANAIASVKSSNETEIDMILGRSTDIYPFVSEFQHATIDNFVDASELAIAGSTKSIRPEPTPVIGKVVINPPTLNSDSTNTASDETPDSELDLMGLHNAFIGSDMWLVKSSGLSASVQYINGAHDGQNLSFAVYNPSGAPAIIEVQFINSISIQSYGLFGFAAFIIFALALTFFLLDKYSKNINEPEPILSVIKENIHQFNEDAKVDPNNASPPQESGEPDKPRARRAAN